MDTSSLEQRCKSTDGLWSGTQWGFKVMAGFAFMSLMEVLVKTLIKPPLYFDRDMDLQA